MKTILRITLGALLAFPLAAVAQWEGTLEMKISGRDLNGTSKAFVGKAGARMQMDLENVKLKQAGQGPVKMVVLTRTAEPDVSYMINEDQKTYAKLDLKKLEEMSPKSEREKKWNVKRLGPDHVAGYACERAVVSQEGADTENELCVSKEIFGSASMLSAGRRGATAQALEKALKSNGLEGMPIRMIVHEKGKTDASVRWELVKAEKRSLPASTFQVPAGYRETNMAGAMMSPEQQRQMEDAMKNMSPEQRKAIEEMMKKKGGSR